jgi:hypothetical protein
VLPLKCLHRDSSQRAPKRNNRVASLVPNCSRQLKPSSADFLKNEMRVSLGVPEITPNGRAPGMSGCALGQSKPSFVLRTSIAVTARA